MKKLLSLIAAGSVALMACSLVTAGTLPRINYKTAATDCQGALPRFAGTLRARPLGIQNEGDAAAFVTCGFTGQTGIAAELRSILVTYVENPGPHPITVTCTLVVNRDVHGPAIYLPRSVNLPSGEKGSVGWGSNEGIPAVMLEKIQMSCLLPPGGLLSGFMSHYVQSP